MRNRPYILWALATALLTAAAVYGLRRYVSLGIWPTYLIAINAITLLLYGYDKWAAASGGGPRVPNRTLLLLATVGGSIGALCGVYLVHHKTAREYFWFRTGIWLLLIVQALIVC